MTISKFQRTILAWHKKNLRDMPWRRTRDPYKILVSEIMLQQTQVNRVLLKYKEFLTAFPTVEALAKAMDKKLLRVWSGLGYWRRAKYLKETAKTIVRDFGGKFPRQIKALGSLPGIGPYTARALACFAFGNSEPFIDTNIRRVYLHFFFPKRVNVSDAEILAVARQAVPKNKARAWHYALFDYGATVLKDKTVNHRSRHYAKQSMFEGSFRSFRTKAIKLLLRQPGQKMSHARLSGFLRLEIKRSSRTPYEPQAVINALLKDKLIKKTSRHYSL